MQYYPIVKNWRKIKKYLNDKNLNDTLDEDFNKFTYGRWKMKFPSDKIRFPRDIETCDWEWGIKGRHPEYFNYVKHSACHWLVNFNLELAKLVEPKRQWRILTSDSHSTVWDGKDTLFDFNFSALQVNPNDAFKIANREELEIDQKIVVNYATAYWIDSKIEKPKDWDSK
jgi:hypothetical protein